MKVKKKFIKVLKKLLHYCSQSESLFPTVEKKMNQPHGSRNSYATLACVPSMASSHPQKQLNSNEPTHGNGMDQSRRARAWPDSRTTTDVAVEFATTTCSSLPGVSCRCGAVLRLPSPRGHRIAFPRALYARALAMALCAYAVCHALFF